MIYITRVQRFPDNHSLKSCLQLTMHTHENPNILIFVCMKSSVGSGSRESVPATQTRASKVEKYFSLFQNDRMTKTETSAALKIKHL